MTGPKGPAQENTGGNSGSSGERQPELRYLAVGRIVRAHGLRGEVSVTLLTDFPERFETTEWVYLGNEFEATPYRLEKYRWHKQNLLLTLAGVTDRNEAEKLKGQFVQVPIEEAVPLPEGSYYLYQLIGLRVESTAGEFLGAITQVMETGANNVYVVQQEDREILLPAIPDVIKGIDVKAGVMKVHLIEGLI
ncbi:MAG: 16S rRNA processing protein RimM [Anaerolineae bacterium]|nr:16S rRNA processing protein RimM [Anaerolineales bacterium]MCQ3974397.1 16S rRNA processing protein RimM [Anaerolineae bacterium]